MTNSMASDIPTMAHGLDWKMDTNEVSFFSLKKVSGYTKLPARLSLQRNREDGISKIGMK